MTSLIVGMGEVGSALVKIIPDVKTYDIKKDIILWAPIDILHICIPWSGDFIEQVVSYKNQTKTLYTIIHSSVPVGTCDKIEGLVFHSPVRGTHPDMEIGLRTYIKYLSYKPQHFHEAEVLLDYFFNLGIDVEIIPDLKTTELMKLLELSRYGVYIAFAKEQEKICQHFGLTYDVVVKQYEQTRNEGITRLGRSELCQPILYPFKDYVGGHCTVEDMGILLGQLKTPLLNEAYNIDRATVIWPNSNIYKTAKIGKGCSIGQFCEIGENVVIGNNVRIGAYTFLPEGTTIEDNVFIAPRVSVSNDKYPPSGKVNWGKILIKEGAAMGMGAVILPGVTIGKGALVGAGSVVTKDVPDGEKWFGNPASPHGLREVMPYVCQNR